MTLLLQKTKEIGKHSYKVLVRFFQVNKDNLMSVSDICRTTINNAKINNILTFNILHFQQIQLVPNRDQFNFDGFNIDLNS